ncbi:heavy-metal-associated domain-containing protein [Microvirga sp. G4-2]|uniref:heavy-metal-associated domain-containing protein n=1 Tax=Microvirga sp. G4-2 TaxID=3434467 RepID=UPI004044D6DF
MHRFHIPGMTCGGCLGAVTKAIQKLDPQARIEGKLENRTITVATDKAEAPLLNALEKAGYPAQAVSGDR